MPTINDSENTLKPHQFWQESFAAGTYDHSPADGHRGFYPVCLPDGRQLALPIRQTADTEALASLIINQASFAVLDELAGALAEKITEFNPDIIVGVPTLGLPLAQEVARKIGHSRYVALGFSKKFWYDQALSVPVRSVTSPGQKKHLYADPRMLPLLHGKTVVLIDDVISTGRSIVAALTLLEKCDVKPAAIGAAMLQTQKWRETLGDFHPRWPSLVRGVFSTPKLVRNDSQGWRAGE